MTNIRSVLIVLAMVGSASAQPGATPPSPQGELPPPGVQVDAQAQAQGPGLDVDAILAKVEAEAPSIETVARGTFRRARRAISIGPTVGAWGSLFYGPGDVDAALTFGLGLELFKVPVMPDVATLKALIMERVKAQVKDRIKDVFKGRQPEPFEAETFAKQVYEEVRAEILGLKDVRGKTMERPRLSVGLEANRLFTAERWLGRIRAGIGVWKFTVGMSVAFGRACRGNPACDDAKLFSGPELTMHFLTSKKPRASVVDVFLRWDLQVTSRSNDPFDQVVIGARFLLDVI